MKILFVEDSGLIRRVMVKAIQEAGFTTVEAENGLEALECLRTHGNSINLVILDWNMPKMSGYDALVKIRSQAQYKDIPVLMATADSIEEDVKKAIAVGISGYIIKPFTPGVLIMKIDSILRAQDSKSSHPTDLYQPAK